MPRRKHALEDSYSSDDDTPQERGITQRDLDDEAEQFRGTRHSIPYTRTSLSFMPLSLTHRSLCSLIDPTHSGRRKRTKEDALYGSFLESGSEDERAARRSGAGRSKPRRREGFEFVAASSSTNTPPTLSSPSRRNGDEDPSSHSDASSRDSEGTSDRDDMDLDEDQDSDEEEEEARREREAAFKALQKESQREIDDYEDHVQAPSLSKPGIGLGPSIRQTEEMEGQESTSSSPAPPANKAMAASIRAGLGLSSEPSSPSSSGNSSRNQARSRQGGHSLLSSFANRAGFKDDSPSSSPRPSTPASTSSPKPDSPAVVPVKVAKDYGAFSAKGSGFGLKMLEKMGWKKGYGLGAGGVGIVEPIQTKLRPVKMGIGFKGFKEKTDQDRAEEKRRGYAHSSDEEEDTTKGKKKSGEADKKEKELKSDGWKKSSTRGSKRKPKVEYKTAAEIQQEIESGDLPMTQAQPQKIFDMTGKQVNDSVLIRILDDCELAMVL